ncbi:MAG TPA: CpsB/CapC family capsule biosynthesis tyrosine phosphatase [Acidobacteriaceae bacterium]|nr:CpsB/CapC family capsule biosynthesis tyrosine phosphatase [Acidobacteriaceae bacterium]
MIDIHHHLLFDLDDGPSDIEISVAMAEMSMQNGVTHIVCTPHSSERFKFDPALNLERLEMIRKRVTGRIELGLGCDFHLMYDNIEDAIANPSKYSINGKQYLLVEFPEHSISPNMREIFFRLGMAGLTSIITHPERNPVLARHPEKMTDWLRSGCYIQITAASLTGRFGKVAQKVAHELLRRNWVHFIATDAHDLTSRPPMLRDTYQLVAEKYGVETADRLCKDNPRAAYYGENLPPQPEMEGIHPEAEAKQSSGLLNKMFGW